MSSLKDIARDVVKAANVINASEKANEQFLVPSLAKRASKAAEQYPYDHAIITAAQVLNKMAQDTPFITRAELNGIYDKLSSNSSKLGEVFAEELDRGELLKGPQLYNRAGEQQDPVNDFNVVADPVLQNALASALDGSGDYKPYSAEVARRAEKVCNAGLMEVGLAPKKISVFAGQEDLILCKAEYQTPKGNTSVVIPVEIKKEAALLPTMFLGQDSFVDLKGDLLKSHIIATAGKSYHVDGEGVLKVLSEVKNGPKKIASEVEMAVIAMRSEGSEAAAIGQGVVGMKIAAEVDNSIKDPEFEKTAEHFEFAERVTSADGAAQFLFSKRIVEAGRDMIVRKMAEFGHKHVQVKVASCEDNKINYAVGVGVNAGMLVPVSVVRNNVLEPKIAAASGKVKSFDKAGIHELVHDTKPDTRVLAASSMSAGLKPSELVEQVKEAVAEGNLLKAEDCINVLGEVDKYAQKVAIAVLLQGISDPMAGSAESREGGSAMQGYGDKFTTLAGQQVRDVPVFNSYNVFYPTED